MFMNEFTILDLLKNHTKKGSLRKEGQTQTFFTKKRLWKGFYFCLLLSTYKNNSARNKMRRFMNKYTCVVDPYPVGSS
jgi:hypothetical protein